MQSRRLDLGSLLRSVWLIRVGLAVGDRLKSDDNTQTRYIDHAKIPSVENTSVNHNDAFLICINDMTPKNSCKTLPSGAGIFLYLER